MSKKSKSLSIIYGALVGDAFGAQLEFLKPRPIPQELMDLAKNMEFEGLLPLVPGQITDDGELTICLLRSIILKKDALKLYRKWFVSEPVDCGLSCTNAFEILDTENTANSANSANSTNSANPAILYNFDSQANGALMRVSPIGALGPLLGWSLEDIANLARKDACKSHPNIICQEANVVYTITIASLVEGTTNIEAINKGLMYCKSSIVCEWVKTSHTIYKIIPHEMNNDNIGWVKWGIMLAFYHLFSNSTYEVAITETCRIGGDTDTNACIVGGLIGAITTIPKKWLNKILKCNSKRPKWLHPSRVKKLYDNLLES